MERSHLLFRPVSYVKFLLRSRDRHGLHSPFVYHFATECLYKKRRHRNKTLAVLLGSIGYFKVVTLHLRDRPGLKETLEGHYPRLRYDRPPFDLVFTPRMEVTEFQGLLAQGQLHNDSLVLVDQIHGSPANQRAWEALAQLPQVSVSIDLFHCGALFIRREQEKEHFRIRI